MRTVRVKRRRKARGVPPVAGQERSRSNVVDFVARKRADERADNFEGWDLKGLKSALWLEENYTDEKMSETYLSNIMTQAISGVFHATRTKPEIIEQIWKDIRQYRESRRRRDRRIKLLKGLIREMG